MLMPLSSSDDHSRVQLNPQAKDGDGDYINANFVDVNALSSPLTFEAVLTQVVLVCWAEPPSSR